MVDNKKIDRDEFIFNLQNIIKHMKFIWEDILS